MYTTLGLDQVDKEPLFIEIAMSIKDFNELKEASIMPKKYLLCIAAKKSSTL